MHLFPDADIPVVQLSIPWTDDPGAMWELGRKLGPLRADGIFVLGSGNVVHNLRLVDWGGGSTPDWAVEFDGHVEEALTAGRAGTCAPIAPMRSATRPIRPMSTSSPCWSPPAQPRMNRHPFR